MRVGASERSRFSIIGSGFSRERIAYLAVGSVEVGVAPTDLVHDRHEQLGLTVESTILKSSFDAKLIHVLCGDDSCVHKVRNPADSLLCQKCLGDGTKADGIIGGAIRA